MNSSVFKTLPRTRVYWIGWAIFVFVFATGRIVVGLRLVAAPQFDLGVCYMLGVWLPIMVLNIYEGRRLMSYLRAFHHDKWAELTTIPGFGGSGHVNGFRSVPWLFSSDTLSDPVLAKIKSDYRHFLYWVLTVFVTMPIFIIAFSTSQ